ncbi:MAG: Ribosomal RNA small subunit methyltransferase I [Candidatus Daviesbacteria bacterium GW2011_GWA2_38_24]|uniref:Ribosomal RNA small subunit methyltransferase I n=1 Tax=Candidatus Daviesbacteria bacterium GW2011_GWA2_38_24 TaxID=1618422 RepID=A0A0G0JUQ0_9BACT|nr:MAG: Ribosomal RNA small subunit methyltransferase I [Candidatus Daviesbacteria bacterium GW2011_GWA2_38_24]KKQ80428.1 MAG: Ribosomal RNA small subunit methyltransferase I [Candidatus Daviesbacteria bacterium GW2011_GWA1_38_7]OGE23875.1 MAG: 16S rRNA (cytidine(1402)-2'-O)-methyltransferase [Candidatus Daviesbacteria bacterium RIFCSPHIGHO2_01_FULL_38_8]
MLYIVATPIGNLQDISFRAIETLKKSDAIICEDTRRANILLSHFGIKKPLLILNDFNESKEYLKVLEKLEKGETLSLISDAGTPLVSDPGYKLVREATIKKIPVDSIPGPVAAILALTLSGLPPDKFFFLGFIPEKPGQRQKTYQNLIEISNIISTTFIFYAAPFKLQKPLEEMLQFFGDIKICLAKELTKMHQKVETKKISEWQQTFRKTPPKGEWVMLLNLACV